jgi:hypothetical protein
VIRYLGRYTHRVGLSNHRLVSMNEQGVTFRTKNGRTLTLSSDAFLTRFLAHVLPSGFVKIRHYGLMSASHATTRLELARARLLSATPVATVARAEASDAPVEHVPEVVDEDLRRCPRCGAIAMVRTPLPVPAARAPPVAA